jgi:hypothetical protein
VTTIEASQRLAALLRAQVPAFRDAGASQRKATDAPSTARPPADLASVVAQRIDALSKDDPDRKRKAFRIFLESLFLQELGAELMTDPAFPDMVSAVQDQMQGDQELAAAADELSEILIAGGLRK